MSLMGYIWPCAIARTHRSRQRSLSVSLSGASKSKLFGSRLCGTAPLREGELEIPWMITMMITVTDVAPQSLHPWAIGL